MGEGAWDNGAAERRPRAEFRAYYEAKERKLVISTAVLGGVWGVLTVGIVVAATSGRGSSAFYAIARTATAASLLGRDARARL